ncbi:MAG TPA: transposase [Gammaproteobacteria bacterium]|nr:transposase [Gammaproteobacteria bacterium]
MPTPRSQLISLDDTPWYHCISRCVRRAWLCGFDKETGTDYEYRREWIVDRLELLSHAFSIEIAAFAVMSNHHHVVLRVDAESPKQWSLEETVRRWHTVYNGNFLSQRFMSGQALSNAEMRVLERDAAVWKERLISISWFMRALNEPIARAANAEDNCTGKFFEARFKSQALLDEKAILAAMAYVDLNPIRAQLAETPENSEYTSIKSRVDNLNTKNPDTFLAPFTGNEKGAATAGVPYHLSDYLELVDWTGRAVRDNQSGSINASLPPILNRLGLTPSDWLMFATQVESLFGNWVGSPSQFAAASKSVGQKWICACEGSWRFF